MTQEEERYQLREENAALRAENLALRTENNELRQQVAALDGRLKKLEERLAKDSRNSHLPPSSDRFSTPHKTKSLRKSSGKRPGGQPGHEGNALYQVQEPDQVIVHAVLSCEQCQHDLSGEPAFFVERRQVVDLPPKRVVVIEHQAQAKACPHCHQISQATFPAGVAAPVQYGPAFAAVGVYLTQYQLLPYARACETISDLIGPSMTVGTLKALVERTACALAPITEQIASALQKGKLMHQDETSLKVGGKRVWLHVGSTSALT